MNAKYILVTGFAFYSGSYSIVELYSSGYIIIFGNLSNTSLKK